MKVAIHIGFATGLFLFSCSGKQSTNNEKLSLKPEEKKSSIGVESMAKLHVEKELAIKPGEVYSLKLYQKDLDGDDKTDAIITVNRKAFAFEKAIKENTVKKSEQLGFVGNNNFMFYYDGGLNKISPAFTVPSSAYSELEVSFEHIHSEAYYDVMVDYRVMDACFRDFYTVVNHTPKMVFQWKVFSGINKTEKEAFTFDFAEGSYSPAKDILVKRAIFEQTELVENSYSFKPSLTYTNELVHRFFFNPSAMKYFTKN